MLLAVVGCSTGNGQGSGGQTGDEFDQVTTRLMGDAPRLEADAASASAAASELGSFAWALYGQAAPAAQNFVYSPYSVATAAAMLYAGAQGATQDEMRDVFAFSIESESFHQAHNALLQTLEARNIEGSEERNAQTLKISNDFWMAARLQPRDTFLNVLSAYYGAPVFLFQGGPEDVRAAINGKVEGDTNQLIQELLPPNSITIDTIFVLTNALYFKANWAWQFSPNATQPAEFTTASGAVATVDMMFAAEGPGFGYANTDGLEVLSMPYFGSELEFVVLAPPADEFESFRADITAQSVEQLSTGLPQEVLNLRFPKLDIAFTLPLKEELMQAGMVRAFSEGEADFSALASNELFIGEAFHQTKLILDEEGTEAAAATAFIGVDESAGPPPIDVTIDRPFLFFIRDIETRALLFVGHFVGPE